MPGSSRQRCHPHAPYPRSPGACRIHHRRRRLPSHQRQLVGSGRKPLRRRLAGHPGRQRRQLHHRLDADQTRHLERQLNRARRGPCHHRLVERHLTTGRVVASRLHVDGRPRQPRRGERRAVAGGDHVCPAGRLGLHLRTRPPRLRRSSVPRPAVRHHRRRWPGCFGDHRAGCRRRRIHYRGPHRLRRLRTPGRRAGVQRQPDAHVHRADHPHVHVRHAQGHRRCRQNADIWVQTPQVANCPTSTS